MSRHPLIQESEERRSQGGSLIQEFLGTEKAGEASKSELFQTSGFDMKPDLSKRFRSMTIQSIINKILHDALYGQKYSIENAEEMTKSLADTIRKKLEGEVYERYKLVVNVVLGERKGEGVKVGARCLWDPETDSYATDSFVNESIFCVATVYGVLFY